MSAVETGKADIARWDARYRTDDYVFGTEPNAFLASQTALGRVGLPDDIGGVIASLLAPANGWINAQRIEASGGMFL